MHVGMFEIESPLGAQQRAGIILKDKSILDINNTWRRFYQKEGYYNYEQRGEHKAPSSINKILAIKEAPISFLNETIELYNKLKKSGDDQFLSFKDPHFLCPLDDIPSYRDFFVHEKHVKKGFELRQEPVPESWYEMPVFYKGSTKSFIGNKEEVLWPKYSDKLDYELELGMVIGRDGRNIKAKDAFKHIFGFTILNDISARDIQKKEMAARLGPAKGKDFCSVMGPVIATADEFHSTEPNLEMVARINGEEWSRGKSGDAHYSWGEIIEHASKEEWLQGGDFFGSGTVGTGCGLELQKWVKPGDEIELEIEKIGILKNRIGQKNA